MSATCVPWPACGAVVDRIGIRHLGAVRPDAAGEVVAADHLGGREGARLDDIRVVVRVVRGVARAAERRVGVVDAAVEHRDLDALAGVALGLHRGGADVGHGLRKVELVVADGRDAHHRAVVGEPRQDRGVHFHEHGVQDQLRAGDDARIGVEPVNPVQQVGLLVAQVDPRLGGLAAREALLDDRGVAQADDHPALAFGRAQALVEARDLEPGRLHRRLELERRDR
jgi:hypothetical protein